jgi:hypothetical protein
MRHLKAAPTSYHGAERIGNHIVSAPRPTLHWLSAARCMSDGRRSRRQSPAAGDPECGLTNSRWTTFPSCPVAGPMGRSLRFRRSRRRCRNCLAASLSKQGAAAVWPIPKSYPYMQRPNTQVNRLQTARARPNSGCEETQCKSRDQSAPAMWGATIFLGSTTRSNSASVTKPD